MSDIAIITANYGDYDQVKTPVKQDGIDVEWVLVTDNLELFAEYDAGLQPYGDERWRVVYRPSNEIPMMAAKYPKTHPWEFTNAWASVWIDSSVQVTSRNFAAEAIHYTLNDDVAQFKHARQCIYDEEAASAPMPKYAGQPMHEQVDFYRSLGHPEQWGLWTCTVIARQHTSLVKELGRQWQREMETWSYQDQISYPFVCRHLGIQPAIFPGAVYRNDWLVIRDHKRDVSQARIGN